MRQAQERSLDFSKTTTQGMGVMGSGKPEADKNVRAPENLRCAAGIGT